MDNSSFYLMLCVGIACFAIASAGVAYRSVLRRRAVTALEAAAGNDERTVTIVAGGFPLSFTKISTVHAPGALIATRECTVSGWLKGDDESVAPRRVRIDLDSVSAVIDTDPQSDIAHLLAKSAHNDT
jgi:hypothetical protein